MEQTLPRPRTNPRPLFVDGFRKRFQHLLKSQHPLLILDGEGTVWHVNAAAQRLLEAPSPRLSKSCFFSMVHGRNLYQVMRDVADMAAGRKRTTSWLLRMRTESKRWRWFKIRATNHLQHDPSFIALQLESI